MKEYLLERDGKYELHKGGIVPDGAIKVPHGAYDYCYTNGIDFAWTQKQQYAYGRLLWQRTPSLNDQYAEIEKVRQTLKERATQYGSFEDVAMTTQKIMDAIAWARGSDKLPAPHQEALHMIASKIARIVNGDCNHKDSWHDIQGYAKLIEDLIG